MAGKKKKPKGREVNRTELAEINGVSLPTIDEWVRRGCPVVQRGGRGRAWIFNTAEVRSWRDDDVLLELVDMEASPDDDGGSGQLPVISKWAARVVLGFSQENVKREIRKLAGALGAFVHQNRWGQPVGQAAVTVIGPDAFDPDYDNLEVWVVEWDQQIDLGEGVWSGEGVTPERVMVGFSPDTGAGNESEYTELSGGAA